MAVNPIILPITVPDGTVAELQRMSAALRDLDRQAARVAVEFGGMGDAAKSQARKIAVEAEARKRIESQRFRDEVKSRAEKLGGDGGGGGWGSRKIGTLWRTAASTGFSPYSMATIAGMGAPVAAGAAAIYGGQLGVNKTAQAMEILSDSTLSGARQTQKLVEQLPIFGGFAKSLDNLSKAMVGLSETLRRNERQTSVFRAVHSIESAAQIRINASQAELATSQSKFQGLRDLPGLAQGPTARSTVAEQREYERFLRFAPLETKQRLAGVDIVAARRGRNETGRQLEAAEMSRQEIEERRTGIFQQISRVKARDYRVEGSADRQRKLDDLYTRLARADTELESKGKEIEAIRLRYKEQSVALGEKESAQRKVGIEYARTELEILRQREQIATSQARTLGGMSVVEREMALASAKLVKRHGLERLPPDVRARAKSLFPGTIGKMEEELGQRFIGRARAVGGEFAKEYEDEIPTIRAKVDRSELTVRNIIEVDEKKLAQAIRDAMQDWVKSVVTEATKAADNERRKREAAQQQQHNAQK
jgi:hypothetical protein